MTEKTDNGGPSILSRRRLLRTTSAVAVAGVAGCAGSPGRGSATAAAQGVGAVSQGPTIGLETVADSFEEPTDFAVPPGSDRRFVLERAGQVYVLGPDGRREPPFLDVSGRMAPVEGERGLLGIAFHPDYRNNGRLYLRYSAPLGEDAPDGYSHTAVLAEFRAGENRTTDRPDSERRLLEVPEPQNNHNAGAVTFGPDGYCYVSFGDGGGGGDAGTGHVADWYDANEGGNGQDVTENLRGSVLRIDVDGREGDKPYAIPDDNPLVGTNGLDEHFAWGFRNPWRMGFSNGDLYVADVGQSQYEEVDIVRKGGNYGWNLREGTHCYPNGETGSSACPDSTPSNVRGGEPLRDPVIEYPHSRDGQPIGVSVIGGYVYDGPVGVLDGQYVFGDFSQDGGPQGALFAATPAEEGLWSFQKLAIAGADNGELNANLLAIGRDDAGDCYALTRGGDLGGGVHRLVSSSGASGSNNPTTGTGTAIGTGTSSGTETRRADADGNETDAGGGASGGATGTGTEGATSTEGGTGTEQDTSSTDGPGFGVLVALAGVAGVAARLLAGNE